MSHISIITSNVIAKGRAAVRRVPCEALYLSALLDLFTLNIYKLTPDITIPSNNGKMAMPKFGFSPRNMKAMPIPKNKRPSS